MFYDFNRISSSKISLFLKRIGFADNFARKHQVAGGWTTGESTNQIERSVLLILLYDPVVVVELKRCCTFAGKAR